jgi:hypothetical protein
MARIDGKDGKFQNFLVRMVVGINPCARTQDGDKKDNKCSINNTNNNRIGMLHNSDDKGNWNTKIYNRDKRDMVGDDKIYNIGIWGDGGDTRIYYGNNGYNYSNGNNNDDWCVV